MGPFLSAFVIGKCESLVTDQCHGGVAWAHAGVQSDIARVTLLVTIHSLDWGSCGSSHSLPRSAPQSHNPVPLGLYPLNTMGLRRKLLAQQSLGSQEAISKPQCRCPSGSTWIGSMTPGRHRTHRCSGSLHRTVVLCMNPHPLLCI